MSKLTLIITLTLAMFAAPATFGQVTATGAGPEVPVPNFPRQIFCAPGVHKLAIADATVQFLCINDKGEITDRGTVLAISGTSESFTQIVPVANNAFYAYSPTGTLFSYNGYASEIREQLVFPLGVIRGTGLFNVVHQDLPGRNRRYYHYFYPFGNDESYKIRINNENDSRCATTSLSFPNGDLYCLNPFDSPRGEVIQVTPFVGLGGVNRSVVRMSGDPAAITTAGNRLVVQIYDTVGAGGRVNLGQILLFDRFGSSTILNPRADVENNFNAFSRQRLAGEGDVIFSLEGNGDYSIEGRRYQVVMYNLKANTSKIVYGPVRSPIPTAIALMPKF